MDWKKELDALKRETATLVERAALTAPPASIPVSNAAVQSTKPAPQQALSPTPPPVVTDTSEREAIAKHVQNFRAHQERLRREREDYYDRTMQRVRERPRG